MTQQPTSAPRADAAKPDAISMADHSQQLAECSRRVVLLGASNLTRGVSTVLATAQAYWGVPAAGPGVASTPDSRSARQPIPLDALFALGHGRSYGITTNVLGRVLTGIRQCGLWRALRARPDAPLAALITDIGNDLLYGSSVNVIAGWVEDCLDRLLEHQARIAVTQLPVKNGLTISEKRFRMFRAIMFPSCRLTLSEVRDRSLELNDRVIALCDARRIPTVEQKTDWYGWDPIHIRLKYWRQAWGEILAPWRAAEGVEQPAGPSSSCLSHTGTPPDLPSVPRPPRRRWLYLRTLAPEERIWFGHEQRQAQPAGRLPDGTTISYY